MQESMAEPVVEAPPVQLRVPKGAQEPARLRHIPGVTAIEDRGEGWLLQAAPGAVDRGHLTGRPLRDGPAERARETAGDAALAGAFAVMAAVVQGSSWAGLLSVALVGLTLLLPARRTLEAVPAGIRGKLPLRVVRRALAVTLVGAAGVWATELAALLPALVCILIAVEAATTAWSAPRWRVRWSGALRSTDHSVERGDLVNLPAGVECPAPSRVELGEGWSTVPTRGAPRAVAPGNQLTQGATCDTALVVRALHATHRDLTAEQRPDASRWLEHLSLAVDGVLVLMAVVVGWLRLRAGLGPHALAEAGLLLAAPVGALQAVGATAVGRAVVACRDAGCRLSSASDLGPLARVRAVAVQTSALVERGWEAITLATGMPAALQEQALAALRAGTSDHPGVHVVEGMGASLTVDGHTWLVGSVDFVGLEEDLDPQVVVVTRDGEEVARGVWQRRLRPEARHGVATLRAAAVPVWRVRSDPTDNEPLQARVGLPGPGLTLSEERMDAWQVGDVPCRDTLWVAASWSDETPPGPTASLEPSSGQITLPHGLSGVVAGMAVARGLRARLRLLLGVAPLCAVLPALGTGGPTTALAGTMGAALVAIGAGWLTLRRRG